MAPAVCYRQAGVIKNTVCFFVKCLDAHDNRYRDIPFDKHML